MIMTRGRAFWTIQASSPLVNAGDASVAVSPDAKVPRRIGAKGKQFDS